MKRFIECIIPVTYCNLKCSYCYIIQQNRRTLKVPDFPYSAEYIGKALSKERLGGISYINLCGTGETLIPKEMPAIVEEILKQGHYVNITTNGTITQNFQKILSIDKSLLQHLHFAFSFHYKELVRTKNIESFFYNIDSVKKAGCSFVVQINLCDDYLPYWGQIKKMCDERLGACPQVAVTRQEKNGQITFFTSLTGTEYKATGREFNSPLWEFTLRNFGVKRREFCYAGDWTTTLNLLTGELRACYDLGIKQNIYEDLNKPIQFEAIGRNCFHPYCINSSHFMSLGTIPSVSTPSYAQLRNREEAGWYSEEMKMFLSGRLYDENPEYSGFRKGWVTLKWRSIRVIKKIKRVFSKTT